MFPDVPPGFRSLGELGRGGGGVVLRAREEATGREVALKLLLDPERDPRRRARFKREAELAAGLNHTGIVKVHAAGETPGGMWIVYELVQGGRTLEDAWGEEDARLSRERRVREVQAVADAVGYAHARGVVHRDLKPQNVLVDPEGRARVTDFGLAAGAGLDRLTHTGHAVGTPHHMAPEQAAGDRSALGPTIDTWALGVLLYEALTGRKPFSGPDAATIMLQLHTRDPDPPCSLDPSIPLALEAVCLKALRRDPAQRQPDAQAFSRELTAALERPATRRARVGPALAVGGLLLAALLLSAALLRGGAAAVGPPEDATGPAGHRRGVLEAWAAGETALARERLREAEAGGPPLDVSCRPWVLALAGEPGLALAGLAPDAPLPVRARLAALAGDQPACLDALLRLAEAQPARARGLGLELRELLPGLPLVGAPEGAEPWAAVARAEEALGAGDAAQAALALRPLRLTRPPGADLRASLALLWLRVSLARGQRAELTPALREAWDVREEEPLLAAEALVWAALLEPLLPPDPGPPLPGVADLRAEAGRRAPGHRCLKARARGTGWGPLAAARAAARSGARAEAAALLAGSPPPDAASGDQDPDGSFARAELARCRDGADGAPGLLLAAAGDLALSSAEGSSRDAARTATRELEGVATLRPDSPALWVLRVVAARVAHDLPRARVALEEASRVAPGDPWVLLERARTGLALLEEERARADLLRAATRLEGGRPEAGGGDEQEQQRAERPVAAALGGVAEAFRQARQAARPGGALEEQARLEGAAVLLERAWRSTRSGGDARAAAEVREQALEELRPLLARVPREALLVARQALVAALRGPGAGPRPDPARREAALRAAEAELACAGAAVDDAARAAVALAAAAAPPAEGLAWARVWLALEGDLPARALLMARSARVIANHDQRRRGLEAARALLPTHPALLLLDEGARLDPDDPGADLGLAPGSPLGLARAGASSPLGLVHAAGLLSAAAGDPGAALTRLEADAAGAGADPATLALGRGLLLLRAGQPDPRAVQEAAGEAGRALRLAARRLTGACGRDGAGVAAAALLRAETLLGLDPAARADALAALERARAIGPWDAACERLRLELVAPEASAPLVDRLLAGGHLANPWCLLRPGQPADLRANLDAIDQALPGFDPYWPPSAFEWAAELARGHLTTTSLLLRICTAGELWDGCDQLETPALESCLRELEDDPGLRGVTGAEWWFLRGERDEALRWSPVEPQERARARRRAWSEALERACHAAYQAAPAGAAALPDLGRRDPAAVSLGWRVPPAERDATADLPGDRALRAWWQRVHRAEQAGLVRARAWERLSGANEASHLLDPAGLSDPWSASWALLLGVQDGEAWSALALLRAGELDEARLALDRLAAFRRGESPPGTWINLLQREVREPARQAARAGWLEWGLELVETPAVVDWDPPAFQALAADLHLDLAGLAAGPEARAPHLDAAWRLFQALPSARAREGQPAPEDEPVDYEPPLTNAWRRVRLYALSGTDPAALRGAVETLRQAADDSGHEPDGRGRVRWWVETEPPATRRLLEAIPELRALIE